MKAFALVLVLAVGCSKSSTSDSPSPVASHAAPSASLAVARPAPSPSGAPARESVGRASWSGSYVAKLGAVEPPANAKEKTWTQDPGTAATGKGDIDLSIDDRGEAQGDTKGPLGEMNVRGVYDGKELRANLAPKQPRADGAMSGFMVLTADGNALKGTLRVSNRDAKVVREASVELAKK